MIGCKKEVKRDTQTTNSVVVIPSNETLKKSAQSAKIESNKVCYVNNKYMGIEQIPVKVEGKTYYGCCEGCIIKLKTVKELRFGLDPFTGNEVDKALAFIVLKPQGNNDVLYFESEKSYMNFIK